VKIGLFIPCYVDAFFPEVGIATLELLDDLAAQSSIRLIRPVVDNRWLTAVVRKIPRLPKPCLLSALRILIRS
jgi:hypothetical protein